jgi:NAD+ synthase (glutamine-hydrolysing)
MVMPIVRLALAQTNPIVGDLEGNRAQILSAVRSAADNGANIVVFGEMSLTGYPIEDLACRESFIAAAESSLATLIAELQAANLDQLAVVVGCPVFAVEAMRSGWAIAHNAAIVIRDGVELGRYFKHHLPNYSVFDEYRNFVAGNQLFSFEHLGLRFSTVICEDIWQTGGPVAQIASNNTDVTLVLNGSPFEIDKDDRRLALVKDLATKQNSAVAYANLVGGQDDLVFDGDSIVVDATGNLVARANQFANDLLLVDLASKTEINLVDSRSTAKQDDDCQAYNALVLGLRDYVHKNGFKSVVLGLSGGIDSALCAVIASDAIGAENVYGISMPSKYSSDHSKSDAQDLAERLGCHYETQAIGDLVASFEDQISLNDTAAENLQARMRALILMAKSNSEGHLTLTTGNKTELAVGYSTIYGDSVGGFAPIKDVEKTLVWQLAKWRNAVAEAEGKLGPIPENSISKPPSAELRPGQVDQDSLPPYEILDALLEGYVQRRESKQQLLQQGFDAATIDRVLGLVDRAEWKRRQGAIGPKITGMAFGRDRRLPITNQFRN